MNKTSNITNNNYGMEFWISSTLKIGVLLSLLLIVIGVSISILFSTLQTHFSQINPSLVELFTELKNGKLNYIYIIFWGILLLILTPIFRVIFLSFIFIIKKEWKYVFISLAVLIMLLIEIIYSLSLR